MEENERAKNCAQDGNERTTVYKKSKIILECFLVVDDC